MEKIWFLLILVAVMLLLQCCFMACLGATITTPATNLTTDHAALLALKAHITTPRPYNVLAYNWSSSSTDATSCCDWIGVTCGHRHQRVTGLNLSYMGLTGTIPPHLGNLSFLAVLDMQNNNFHGHLPDQLSFLRRLRAIDLRSNVFSGQIPYWIGLFPKLQNLTLFNNGFSGSIPSSIYNMSSLRFLALGSNYLSSSLPVDMCTHLPQLEFLCLHENQLYGQIPSTLGQCTRLWALSLWGNKITGSIPKEIGNNLTMLEWLDLGYNSLTGRHNISGEIPKTLSFPGMSTIFFQGNKLSGVLPASICNLSSLELLDLSNNNFSGLIPPCFGNLSSSLTVLNLRRNNFYGTLPDSFVRGSILRTLDVSDNQLHGIVPQSLTHCTKLEVLNLGKNSILDTYPLWLEILPELQVLILRSNRFYGRIAQSKTESGFRKLNIIDVSFNDFTGNIPSKLFESLTSMAVVNANKSKIEYMGDDNNYYSDSITLIYKGLEVELVRILTIFKAVDFSNNKFEGEIPKSIENLQSVIVLNLSGNGLTGRIPPFLGKLRELQSLDLSKNKLSREIPQQLISLTFLSVFDVSQNHLEGPIPQGGQFETFANTSYEGNSGLCGFPLSKKCGNGEKTPSPPSTSEESQSSNKFIMDINDLIVVLMGYSGGLVIGVVAGNYIFQRKEEWLMNFFGIRQQYRRGRRMNRYRRKHGGR